MQERTLTLPGAAATGDVALLEGGVGGRPLLLVHGFTGAKEDFADHLDAIAQRGWWVVAPDLRGHGSSPMHAEESDYSLEHFADDVWTVADGLGWDRLVLLGHSMGGMVAQVAAIRAHERLDGLVLMDTSPGSVEVDRALVELGAELARNGGMAAVKEVLDEMGSDAPLGSEAYERILRERPGYREFGDRKFLGSSSAMYASMLLQLLDQRDRLDALAELRVPCLVMVGDQDESFLEPSRHLARTIPEAQFAVIPEAGHSPQFENPIAWFDVLAGFLDGLR